MGHKAWAENAKTILESAIKNNIEYLTLWALSTENLTNRDPEEIKAIIKLIDNIENLLWEALENNVRFLTIWNTSLLPKKSQDTLEKIIEKTKKNTGTTVTIALVYGGQDEIIRAIHNATIKWEDMSTITLETLHTYLDTHILPLPDLIIRTGWDTRHSWFLLFDSAYSEYYFTQKKWPEFSESDFLDAIETFLKAKRNFGK